MTALHTSALNMMRHSCHCHVIRHVGGAAASKPELFFRGKVLNRDSLHCPYHCK